jgi:hypothetical protein
MLSPHDAKYFFCPNYEIENTDAYFMISKVFYGTKDG